MEYTEIKIDVSTLPTHGQRVEFETYTHTNILGYYDAEEEAFIPFDDEGLLPVTHFDVYKWKPLNHEFY